MNPVQDPDQDPDQEQSAPLEEHHSPALVHPFMSVQANQSGNDDYLLASISRDQLHTEIASDGVREGTVGMFELSAQKSDSNPFGGQ